MIEPEMCFIDFKDYLKYVVSFVLEKSEEEIDFFTKLYNEITDSSVDNINPALPRQSLKIFGGTLSIEEFRECNTDYLKNL